MALIIDALELLITGKCNFNCAHCMRGGNHNITMTDEMIEKILSDVKKVNTLNISGGEPLLAVDKIEKIIQTIIERKIKINNFNIFTNGTPYTKSLDKTLGYFKQSVSKYQEDPITIRIMLSQDQFHRRQVQDSIYSDLYQRSIDELKKSPYCAFLGLKIVDRDGPNARIILLNEGNAKKLNTQYARKVYENFPVTYQGDSDLYVGPIVCINPWGTVTNCDASFENQETRYNYGNINNSSLEQILRGIDIEYKSYGEWKAECADIIKLLY